MDSFNKFAYGEAELVRVLEDLDIQIENLQRRVEELNVRYSEKTEELLEIRNKMKAYLENEFGIATQK